jgi:hypothetical protein
LFAEGFISYLGGSLEGQYISSSSKNKLYFHKLECQIRVSLYRFGNV